MSGGGPRPLAPLWARAVLAAAIGSLAAQAGDRGTALFFNLTATFPHDRDFLAFAAPPILAGLGAVMALGWPSLRPGRAAILACALLAGLWLARRTERALVDTVLCTALCAGAAASLLRRPGDPPGRPSARAVLARLYAGGVVAPALAGAAWLAIRAKEELFVQPQSYWGNPPQPDGPGRAVAAGLLAVTLVLGVEAGARLARRAGWKLAVALLPLVYAVAVMARGEARTCMEVRLDTGDVRTYYLGMPFVALRTEPAPDPDRRRLLALARGSALLEPRWVRCMSIPPAEWADSEERIRLLYREARGWIERDPRLARFFMEDLAAQLTGRLGGRRPDHWKLMGSAHGYAMPEDVREYGAARGGYDPFHPFEGAPETLEGLLARARGSVFFDERAEALRRLVQLFPGQSREPLAAALEDPDPVVREMAALRLAAVGDGASLEALRAARERDRDRANGRATAGPLWIEAPRLDFYDDAIRQLEQRGTER